MGSIVYRTTLAENALPSLMRDYHKTKYSDSSSDSVNQGDGKLMSHSRKDKTDDNLKENSNSNLISQTRSNGSHKNECIVDEFPKAGHAQSPSRISSVSSITSVDSYPGSCTCSSESSTNSGNRADHFYRTPLAPSYRSNPYFAYKGPNILNMENCYNKPPSVPKDCPELSCTGPSYPPPRLPFRSNSSHIRKVIDDDFDVCPIGDCSLENVFDNTMLCKGGADTELKSSSDWERGFRQSRDAKKLMRSLSFNASNSCSLNLSENVLEKQPNQVKSGKAKSVSGCSVSEKISSQCRTARSVAEKLVRALPGRSKSKSTVPEKDLINFQTNGRIHKEFSNSLDVTASVPGTNCTLIDEQVPIYNSQGLVSGSNPYRTKTSQERQFQQTYFLHDGQQIDGKYQFQVWPNGYEMDDKDLDRRAQEAQERVEMFSRQLDSLNSYNGNAALTAAKTLDPNVELLQTKLRHICEEKRNLALELSYEIQQRISERLATKETIDILKKEMEAHAKMVESEKNDLQSSLEKELDRRSNEWSNMLEKIKVEEKRLRDRVRDLAEQNVSLQREVSSLHSRDTNLKDQIRESENCIQSLKTSLGDAENEIARLRDSLSESCMKARDIEDDRNLIKRNYKEKESKNNELQKLVAQLQRLCGEQEKTISGLWHSINSQVKDNNLHQKKSNITNLQAENLRLISSEQTLRKDLENCRFEVDILRQENASLLERVRGWEKDSGLALINLDQELQERLDGLQAQALGLLDDSNYLCSSLLNFTKNKLYSAEEFEIKDDAFSKGFATEQERDRTIEFETIFIRLSQRIDSLKKNIQFQNGVLKEKSHISCKELPKQDPEVSLCSFSDVDSTEIAYNLGDLHKELKAETLLSKVLKEKLWSSEVELERLQEEVANLVRTRESLSNENLSLQKMLNQTLQKEKELQIQAKTRMHDIKHLQNEWNGCCEELSRLTQELSRTAKERDNFQQNAEQLSWENKTLAAEVQMLKKRIEKLDEDVLFKEGQLSILREGQLEEDVLFKGQLPIFEVELERLQEEVANLVRTRVSLSNENLSLQKLLNQTLQKEKDLQIQAKTRMDHIKHLQNEWYGCCEELSRLTQELSKTAKELSKTAIRRQRQQSCVCIFSGAFLNRKAILYA